MPELQAQPDVSALDVKSLNGAMPWYFCFFVLSGFCGLLYEVIWVRLAMSSFGVNTALVSIVLSMFMAGLGLGSWGAGRLTRQAGARRDRLMLRLYALAELLVGFSSIAVPMEFEFGRNLLRHVGSPGEWQSSSYFVIAGICIGVSMIPWCACMGATFPLLMAEIRRGADTQSERSFSYLYVANVLGALLGTTLSAFVLIELFGFRSTLAIAGCLNAVIALLAFWLSFSKISGETKTPQEFKRAEFSIYGLRRRTVRLLLFATGMISMAMEVVWIRQLTPYLGNVVYAFAGILAMYLLGNLMGSRDYRRWALSHDPNESARTWSLLAVFALLPLAGADPLLPLNGVLTGLLRLLTIGFFCALTGFLTPLLVDSCAGGEPEEAGVSYAINIAGCIAGPLLSSFWLLPHFGERWSLMLLSIPLYGIAWLAIIKAPKIAARDGRKLSPKLQLGLAAAAGLVIFLVTHDFESKFAQKEVRRDYTASVIATGTGMDKQLLVNGYGMTTLTPITKYMAHLSLAFLPRRPQNALVVCFGMGTTFRSLLSWGIHTTAVELVPSVPKLFHYYHSDADQLAASPLARIVIDDGRRFLDGSTESYDVIIVDPPPPPAAAGSSLLYSEEFYAVVKRHLRPGGIFQTWFPEIQADAATEAAVTKSIVASFPYVRAFYSYDRVGVHYLASMDPLPASSGAELASRLPAAATSDLTEWGPAANATQQFDLVLSHEVQPQQLIAKAPKMPAILDDQPGNEYFLLRQSWHLSR